MVPRWPHRVISRLASSALRGPRLCISEGMTTQDGGATVAPPSHLELHRNPRGSDSRSTGRTQNQLPYCAEIQAHAIAPAPARK